MKNLKNFLSELSEDELNILYKLVDADKADIDSILKSFSKLMLPFGGILQKGKSYRGIMNMIAHEHNKEQDNQNDMIDVNPFVTEVEAERVLFLDLYKKELSKMSDEDLKELIHKMKEGGLNKSQIAALTSLAGLGAAQASGFAIYILASSTVGAISGALGIALPFAFYTTLSSTISVIIGPLGFLVLGYGLYRTFRKIKSLEEAKELFVNTGKELKNFAIGNYERGEIVFKFIASLRIVKSQELESKLKELESEIGTLQEQKISNEKQITSLNEDIGKLDIELTHLEAKIKSIKINQEDLF